jgi:hypothetical protein
MVNHDRTDSNLQTLKLKSRVNRKQYIKYIPQSIKQLRKDSTKLLDKNSGSKVVAISRNTSSFSYILRSVKKFKTKRYGRYEVFMLDYVTIQRTFSTPKLIGAIITYRKKKYRIIISIKRSY